MIYITSRLAWTTRQPPAMSPTRSHIVKLSPSLRCQASVRPTEHLFVFGLGYTGRAIANVVRKAGWSVSGTYRRAEQQQFLADSTTDTICFGGDQNDPQTREQMLGTLQQATHILCTIPPSSQDNLIGINAAPALALDMAVSLQAAELVLAHAASFPTLQWIGYLSSTGVYGDWGGSWVDESSELRLATSKSSQRAEAEAAWLRLYQDHGLPIHVFRLGGIYGPGRSALQAAQQLDPGSLSQQRRSLQQYTARCHVQDICTALLASMRQPCPGSVYNVVDDDPASRTEVMAYARSLLQSNAAPAGSSTSTSNLSAAVADKTGRNLAVDNPSQQERLHKQADFKQHGLDNVQAMNSSSNGTKGEKRVSNGKIKSELSVTWEFPSYREGLSAIHYGDRHPFD